MLKPALLENLLIKGGEICIFNCTDYFKEAEHQLSDRVYHEKLMTNVNDNDPIPLYKRRN